MADGRIPVGENVEVVSLLECAGHKKNAVIEGWSACERGRLTKRMDGLPQGGGRVGCLWIAQIGRAGRNTTMARLHGRGEG